MANKWYTYTDSEDAQNLLYHINDNANFPITGRNARTGELEPTKQKTEEWEDDITYRSDNKFSAQKPPRKFYDKLGIDQTEEDSIISTYVTTPGGVEEDINRNLDPSDDEYSKIEDMGTLSATSAQPLHPVEDVADNNKTTYWRSGGDVPQNIECELPSAEIVVAYRIAVRATTNDGHPIQIRLLGSNNGTDWDVLHNVGQLRFKPGGSKRFFIETPASYLHYRLRILNANTATNATIAEWILLKNV